MKKIYKFTAVLLALMLSIISSSAESGGVMEAYGKTPAKIAPSGNTYGDGFSNPLISHKYGADPYALVYNDRLYIYMTGDKYEYDGSGNVKENSYGTINTINVISTDDMVNWTDHGEIKVAGPSGAAMWAAHSWAPAIAYKNIDGKDKFFLYFANDASNIGVITADSPTGPWTDPRWSPIISRKVPGVEDVTWCFDPAVLVDDDGSAYLYFGGGLPSESEEDILHPKTARVIKLSDDMISVEGEAVLIDAPALFEDSGIHKFNGKYYYSYCSNFSGKHPDGYPPAGEIAYMVSENPMGPFTYVGTILKNPGTFFGVGGNNHHAIFQYKDKWYITYHAQTLGKALGITRGYRSTHINEIFFGEDGSIEQVNADMEGISQLKDFNPYQTIDAETFAWNAGVSTSEYINFDEIQNKPNLILSGLKSGSWTALSKVDFGEKGADNLTVKLNSGSGCVGGKIEIRLDTIIGELVGEVYVPSGLSVWQELECKLQNVTGLHNVYFVFLNKDNTEEELFKIDSWRFTENMAVTEETTLAVETLTPDTEVPDTVSVTTPTDDDNELPENQNSAALLAAIVGVAAIAIAAGVIIFSRKKKK